ncbi:MAG: AbrB/MazE/SpoVT family DNA-binding domain-containing protein [Aquificae bacterium]|nr:AbrB/MazE/SpoVT family DNA-binding domain-containing protein [Aquificota bacterium]
MLIKKTSKNQITLPKEILKQIVDTDYFEVKVENGNIVLIPARVIPAKISLKSIREKIKLKGLNERDIDEAIKWAREKA